MESVSENDMDRSVVLNASGIESRSQAERRPSPPSMDRLLDTIANTHRRHVIRCLFEREGPIAFERLVAIVAEEVGDETDAVDEDDHETARIALHHSHLPKLVDRGVVALDHDAETVEPGPQLPTVANCLDALERARDENR